VQSTTDTEVSSPGRQAKANRSSTVHRGLRALERLYAFVALQKKLIGARDPLGIRPW